MNNEFDQQTELANQQQMRFMTVRELREMLSEIPEQFDNSPVVLRAEDDKYRLCQIMDAVRLKAHPTTFFYQEVETMPGFNAVFID